MSDIVIRVENLGKMYRIGTEEHRPANFWQATKQLAASPFDYLRRITRPPTEEETLWALKDVSFEVHRGEVVGVIGRNGAGKSTLLKILSRITEPTTGIAEIHGRVGSLLEVGTGFHPELTGRENIYLNGAILGMKRTEIDRKFDEIVDFSGVERFLDTPVKRYSSGMYVRLAFAVAAHLDPEILLVDEVLAVGDAEFQKKCLGKMGDIAGEGRTVLFVSHNMAAIQKLCCRAILLMNGTIGMQGAVEDTISRYSLGIEGLSEDHICSLVDHPGRPAKTQQKVLQEIRLYSNGTPTRVIQMGNDVEIEVVLVSKQLVKGIHLGLSVENYLGSRVTALSTVFQAPEIIHHSFHKATYRCLIRHLLLLPGIYHISLVARGNTGDIDRVDHGISFQVEGVDFFGTGYIPEVKDGIYVQEAEWQLKITD